MQPGPVRIVIAHCRLACGPFFGGCQFHLGDPHRLEVAAVILNCLNAYVVTGLEIISFPAVTGDPRILCRIGKRDSGIQFVVGFNDQFAACDSPQAALKRLGRLLVVSAPATAARHR